jgi:hypothetical protein
MSFHNGGQRRRGRCVGVSEAKRYLMEMEHLDTTLISILEGAKNTADDCHSLRY